MPWIAKPLGIALIVLCSAAWVRLPAQAAPVEVLVAPQPKATQPEPAVSSVAKQPKVVVTGYSLSSETDAASIQHGGEASLPAGQPEVIVFFDTAVSGGGPVEFRYRLSDYDADWTATPNRSAHYRKLTPGDYRFEVQARVPGQGWGTDFAEIAVVQQPFFYQTWYAYLLLFLGLVALTAQLLRQRDQLLKGQMGMVLEERNRIASDCHDTLMAGFAAISWQLEATAKLFRDAGTVETPAAQSCELARSMVSHCQAEARRIIWDLRDSDELTNVLSHALSRAVEAHRLRDSIETTFEIEGDEIPIAPGAVHHLVCIGQEAVTNAIRHADSSRIAIRLTYGSEALSLSIRDNGRGFQMSDASTRTGHFGIPVMEERARKLGGTLRLNSAIDSGTEVSVTVLFQTINLPAHQQHYVVPWIGV